jgi:hypothetical protein
LRYVLHLVPDFGLWHVSCFFSRIAGNRKRTKIGSGFKTMCEGMPPCDTIVGGLDEAGKGTKVWRFLDAWVGRPVRNW